MGDFNDVSNSGEKFSGLPPNRFKLEVFNDFLDKSNLIELGFLGPKYT